MSATLSTIIETGGDFITRAAAGGTIAASSPTGVILTLDPPAGQRVRLTHLSTSAAGSAQVGITVLFGSDTVIDAQELDGDTPNQATKFSIGNYQAYAAGAPPFTNYHQFTGKTDETLTIVKNTGATIATIYYGYEYGL